jgi:transposase
MRYELTDYEWTAIKPMLPNKPRGVPRANDRRVLNGIFWVLRSGAPWRDLRKLAANYLAFVQLASIRLWLRVNESAS